MTDDNRKRIRLNIEQFEDEMMRELRQTPGRTVDDVHADMARLDDMAMSIRAFADEMIRAASGQTCFDAKIDRKRLILCIADTVCDELLNTTTGPVFGAYIDREIG